MKPHKTKNKCSMCDNKAWVISSKINIPVYCRTCYNQLVNKCDELSTWCDKCGHKIPVCENHRICKKKQSKVIMCYGCWFNKNNIKNRDTIKFFFKNLIKQTDSGFKVARAMNDTFEYIESCLCVFSYCRDCRC